MITPANPVHHGSRYAPRAPTNKQRTYSEVLRSNTPFEYKPKVSVIGAYGRIKDLPLLNFGIVPAGDSSGWHEVPRKANARKLKVNRGKVKSYPRTNTTVYHLKTKKLRRDSAPPASHVVEAARDRAQARRNPNVIQERIAPLEWANKTSTTARPATRRCFKLPK